MKSKKTEKDTVICFWTQVIYHFPNFSGIVDSQVRKGSCSAVPVMVPGTIPGRMVVEQG